jgi:Ca2+-binding EF-hand superfamily protein
MFEKYDDKKLGKIKLEDLEEGLKKSDKIKLSKTQIYLLKNIVPSDPNGNVSYIEHSKFISEMIKKFYLHSSKK